MRTVYAAAAGIALLAGQTLVGPSMAADTAPLAPGKPAGLKKAQVSDSDMALYVIGGAAVIAGIAVLASDNGSNATTTPPATTTTNTSTSTSTST